MLRYLLSVQYQFLIPKVLTAVAFSSVFGRGRKRSGAATPIGDSSGTDESCSSL